MKWREKAQKTQKSKALGVISQGAFQLSSGKKIRDQKSFSAM
jgi:hypothetical protein